MNTINGLQHLRCPVCKSNQLVPSADLSELHCAACNTSFPVSHGRPVLLKPGNDVFSIDDYRNAGKAIPKKPGISAPSPSVNLSGKRILANLQQLLAEMPNAIVLVVGGGRQREWLNQQLGEGKTVKVIYSDIDIHSDVDLFCDGHDLPFQDSVFDAVVTTAVLEHVLYPERVVEEIHRVLKTGGLLYSEIPFMQQVHEGAYDFTRYTLSGHRRLLNGFEQIEAGMVAGPGTSLVWAIENFILAFFSRPLLRKVAKGAARLFFFWIKYFDYPLAKKSQAMDGASCTFFFGRKINGQVPDAAIIQGYVGAKYLSHT